MSIPAKDSHPHHTPAVTGTRANSARHGTKAHKGTSSVMAWGRRAAPRYGRFMNEVLLR